jgi:hypothetical protein
MEGVEWIKIKFTHSIDTLINPLNINLNINNERQNSKIGTVYGRVLVGGGRVNEKD